MNVQERHIGDAVVLDLAGHLTCEAGSERLRGKVNGLLQQGVGQLYVNLDGDSYMDSCGLGQLVASFTAVSDEGGSLKLFNLDRRSTRHLLAITRLLSVFETYGSEEDALQDVAQQMA